MRIEPRQVATIIPMQNYILCTAVFATDVMKLNGLDLKVDTTYNPAMYAPIVQKVVRVPKTLYYGRETRFVTLDKGFDPVLQANRQETAKLTVPIPNCMPHRCEMELRPDDIVYCDGHSLLTAESDNRVFECDGVKYFLVKYEDVYFRLENGAPYMLNSWILVEPISEPKDERVSALEQAGIVFPGITITNDNRKEMGVQDKMGVVRHLGLPVLEHMDPDTEEIDEINVGDTVVFKWGANRRLEFGGARFFGDTELVVTKRHRLIAKISDGSI